MLESFYLEDTDGIKIPGGGIIILCSTLANEILEALV